MTILILYVAIALLVSFLCSISESVLLSVTTAHINVAEKEGKASGPLLRELKRDINRPLTAILTLNTIAHTVGAVGAGAQANHILMKGAAAGDDGGAVWCTVVVPLAVCCYNGMQS